MTSRNAPRETPGAADASPASPGNRQPAKRSQRGSTGSSARAERAGGNAAARTRRTRSPGRSRARPRATRIIAVANQKGGVGKSTTAVSIGAALAEIGRKVLVVDLDPQGNASTGLGIRHETRDLTVYDVLAAEAPIDGAVMETPVPGLFAIPASIDLAGAEIELVSQFSRELRLRRALEPLRQSDYDFIFLDCPPSLGLLTVNALAAAEELIVPIQCEYYALEGLGQLLRNVGLVQQNVNPSLRLTGIVMTMYDSRTKLSEQVLAEVRRYFGKRVYKTVIPRTVRLSEAPGFGQPITVYDPGSRGAASYRELAREVDRRLPSDEPLPRFEDLPVGRPEFEPATAPRALHQEEPAEEEPPEAEEEPPEAEEEPPEAEEEPPEAEEEPPEAEEEPPEAEEEPPEAEEVAADADAEALPSADQGLEPEPEVGVEATVPSSAGEPEDAGVGVPEPEADVESRSATEARETSPTTTPMPRPEGKDETAPTGEQGARPTVTEARPVEVAAASTPSEGSPEGERASGPARGVVTDPRPSSEGASIRPDRDGTEEWIAAVEAEARSEAEPAPTEAVPPPVREIDLEPEAGPQPSVEPGEVIRIEDRDAAGDHGAGAQGDEQGLAQGRRRWGLFRRGGSR